MSKNTIYIFFLFCCLLLGCDSEAILEFNPVVTPCEFLADNTNNAEEDFNSNINADNYTELCLAYKIALANQITSCGDETSELSEKLDELGDCSLSSFFQVDFDGQTFFADTASGTISQGKLTIEAFRGPDGEKVEIELFETFEGIYQLGLNNSNGMTNTIRYTTKFNDPVVWESISNGNSTEGQINITEIDFANNWISGTFSFTGYDDNGEIKEFSNGQFQNIPFDKGNEFFAKVDGEEFVDVVFLVDDGNFGSLAFSVRNTIGASITIAMNPNISPGTYNFNNFPLLPSSDYTPFFNDFHSGEGTLTIIQHNITEGVIVGTFEFTALPVLGGIGSYEITEGSFCMYYY